MFMQEKIYFLQQVSFTEEVKMMPLVLHTFVSTVIATLNRAESL